MGNNVFDRTIQKIISMLLEMPAITKYTGTGATARIYGAHISTIQDRIFPAISIHLLSGCRRDVSTGALDFMELQIDPWFDATGKNGYVWDDVMDCHAAIV